MKELVAISPTNQNAAPIDPVRPRRPNEISSSALGMCQLGMYQQDLGVSNDVDHSATALGPESDLTGCEREQSVIPTPTDVFAGMKVRAVLAHDDLAGLDLLTTEALHAQVLSVRVATVAR